MSSKLKTSVLSKTLLEELKGKLLTAKKIFANLMSDKELVSRIKNLAKSIQRKPTPNK